jgi:CheY-like chemotaxis protein
MRLALVLDDSDKDVAIATKTLSCHDYHVVTTNSLLAARALVAARHFDLVLIDINIKTSNGTKGTDNGLVFARAIRERYLNAHVILWNTSSSHHDAAKRVGALYITKSKYNEDRLGAALRELRDPQ